MDTTEAELLSFRHLVKKLDTENKVGNRRFIALSLEYDRLKKVLGTVQKEVNNLILRVPTGDNRNTLTNINIALLETLGQ